MTDPKISSESVSGMAAMASSTRWASSSESWGFPYQSLHQPAVSAWVKSDTPENYEQRGVRRLVGFYLANIDHTDNRQLVWYPGCAAFEYDLQIATHPYDYEDDVE